MKSIGKCEICGGKIIQIGNGNIFCEDCQDKAFGEKLEYLAEWARQRKIQLKKNKEKCKCKCHYPIVRTKVGGGGGEYCANCGLDITS